MLFEIAGFLEVEVGELLTLKKDLLPVGDRKESIRKPAARKATARKGASRRKR
jgi:hypothetical protein